MSLTTSDEKEKEKDVVFWMNDPNVIFDKDHFFEFFPTEEMTFNQKMNAITRLTIIVSFILFAFTKNIWVLITMILTVISIVLYHHHKCPKKTENYENPAQVYLKQSGKQIPSSDNLFEESNSKNPLANVMVTDYEFNSTRKPAPPTSNETILKNAKKMVEEQNPNHPNISEKLFKDLNEELNFEQSMRPFYSTANTTIPNDQSGFIDFCYGDSVSCKEGNLFACARNTSHYTLY